MLCSFCGRGLAPGARYCGACGRAAPPLPPSSFGIEDYVQDAIEVSVKEAVLLDKISFQKRDPDPPEAIDLVEGAMRIVWPGGAEAGK